MRYRCLFLIFVFSNILYGYINIYPTEFDKDITSGVTETFRLYNRTDEEIKYRIYFERTEKNDFSNWIEIYPKSISLKPLEEKEIKLLVTPPISAKEGKYSAKLVIKQVDLPQKKKDDKVKLMTIFKLKMKGYISKKSNGTKK